MLTPPLPHACFFHFSDTCSLGSIGSTKFLESMLSLIPFWRAGLALVLECYVCLKVLILFWMHMVLNFIREWPPLGIFPYNEINSMSSPQYNEIIFFYKNCINFVYHMRPFSCKKNPNLYFINITITQFTPCIYRKYFFKLFLMYVIVYINLEEIIPSLYVSALTPKIPSVFLTNFCSFSPTCRNPFFYQKKYENLRK
jgi:hypothetical protein